MPYTKATISPHIFIMNINLSSRFVMDGLQEKMVFSLKSYGLDDKQFSYAHHILKALKYKSDEGLNIKQINSIFENTKEKTIKNIIDKMNNKLIKYDSKKSHGREKRYFITKAGLELIDKYYSI